PYAPDCASVPVRPWQYSMYQDPVRQNLINKSDSTFILLDDKEASPKASASDTRKDSPPEREKTVLSSSPISLSSTCKPDYRVFSTAYNAGQHG
ncbi:hypothetical protein, partial [Chitinophaga pinensis]|uniref:hypothetical protein n=1 Tax=Chitinophaga pinensis TaxID=79329 RepID=UPI001C991B68